MLIYSYLEYIYIYVYHFVREIVRKMKINKDLHIDKQMIIINDNIFIEKKIILIFAVN